MGKGNKLYQIYLSWDFNCNGKTKNFKVQTYLMLASKVYSTTLQHVTTLCDRCKMPKLVRSPCHHCVWTEASPVLEKVMGASLLVRRKASQTCLPCHHRATLITPSLGHLFVQGKLNAQDQPKEKRINVWQQLVVQLLPEKLQVLLKRWLTKHEKHPSHWEQENKTKKINENYTVSLRQDFWRDVCFHFGSSDVLCHVAFQTILVML